MPSLLEEIRKRRVNPVNMPLPEMPVDVPQDQMPLARPPMQPNVNAGMPPTRPLSAEIQDRLNTLNAPPTRKQALLQAVAQVAPIAMGGLFGGSVGASGAAQGVEQQHQEQLAQRNLQRKTLSEEIEAQKNREERMSERQLTAQTAEAQRVQQAGEFQTTQQRLAQDLQSQNDRAANQIKSEDTRAAATLAEAVRQHNAEAAKPQSVGPGTGLVRPGETAPFYTQPALPPQQQAPMSPGRFEQEKGLIGARGENRPEATVVIRTTDPQGNPVTEIVPKKAGSTFAAAPTVQQQNVAGQAKMVHEQTPYMLSELDRLKGKLGPYAGRLNEIMQGKIGMQDPDFAGLGADLLMYSSAVALMHARGRLPENLREEFQKTIDNPGQDFQNLKAIITKIDGWAVKNPGVSAGGEVRTVNSKAEYDALPSGTTYMEDGQKFRKP